MDIFLKLHPVLSDLTNLCKAFDIEHGINVVDFHAFFNKKIQNYFFFINKYYIYGRVITLNISISLHNHQYKVL